jgi:hypothetical protein
MRPPNDPQTTTQTWIFNSDETVITFTDAAGTYDATVTTLNEDQLIIKQTEAEDNVVYTFTITLEPK